MKFLFGWVFNSICTKVVRLDILPPGPAREWFKKSIPGFPAPPCYTKNRYSK